MDNARHCLSCFFILMLIYFIDFIIIRLDGLSVSVTLIFGSLYVTRCINRGGIDFQHKGILSLLISSGSVMFLLTAAQIMQAVYFFPLTCSVLHKYRV